VGDGRAAPDRAPRLEGHAAAAAQTTKTLGDLVSQWQEYDPGTGLAEINQADDNGQLLVHKYADVQPVVDQMNEVRNTGAANRTVMKGPCFYARIPLAVQYKMLVEDGINVHNRNHDAKLFELVNTKYKYLKATDKNHWLKRNR
jgi:hypothetical protein